MLQYPLLFYSKQLFVNYSTSFVNHPFIVTNSWSLLDSVTLLFWQLLFFLISICCYSSSYFSFLFYFIFLASGSILIILILSQSHRLHSAHSLKQFKLIFEIMKSGLLREETSRFLYPAKSLSTSKMQCEFCLLMRWLKLPVTLLQANEN